MRPLLTTMAWLLVALVSRAADAPSAARGVKWHPGHYAYIQSAPIGEAQIFPGFRGIQKSYNWRLLEPEKDAYDFSSIHSDLAFLARHEKCLIIQIQTKAFGAGQNCCPAYLASPEYGGGLYQTRWGSFNPMIWDQRVNARLNALYRALGRELDREPSLEAVVIPETAITGDPTHLPGEPYTTEKYIRSIEGGMQTLKTAFPTTVVLQYVNMPVETIEPLAAYAKAHGIGFGGPDIYPHDPLLTDPQRGVYRIYAPLSGIVPLGAAVQQNDYTQQAAFRGPPGETPVKEIYEYGRDHLHLNYIFWSVRKGYIERVQQMLAAPAFPKDPAGGLNAEAPQLLGHPHTEQR